MNTVAMKTVMIIVKHIVHIPAVLTDITGYKGTD